MPKNTKLYQELKKRQSSYREKMNRRKAHLKALRLALYITVKRLYVKSAGYCLSVAFIR